MIDLIGKRNYFFILSAVIILAGIIGLLVNGLQLDIQFQGGTLIQIEMPDNTFDTARVETVISQALNKRIIAQKLQTYNANESDNQIDLLMLKVSKKDTLDDKELNKVIEVLRSEFNVKQDAQTQVQSVAPFIGAELLGRGLRAAVIASILIILYVWWRFSVMSGFSAAIIAIIALFHDFAIMLSTYTVFKIPLNESFIAAILTILGYSLNDTIIIYDRIRENSKLLKKTPIAELVNRSVVQTMTRSINTVGTTLISITSVYVFATIFHIQSLREFSFPLIIGIASGAYSSIFIASPLLVMWKQSRAVKKVALKVALKKAK